MRVEIRTQKSVPHTASSGERRTNTAIHVVLVSRGQEVVVNTFSWPGSFLDGFLSETQAKVRARETAEKLKTFLAAQGSLDEEEIAPTRVKKNRQMILDEPRSFAQAG